jgi:hypothetical protein
MFAVEGYWRVQVFFLILLAIKIAVLLEMM